MLYSETSEEILSKMLADVDDSYQKTIGFPTYDLLHALALVLSKITLKLDELAEKQDITNLSGDELSRFVSQRTIVSRKEARPSEVTLKVSGNGIVTKGDIFESEGGLQFAADETTTVTETAYITATCTVGGYAGNVVAGAINKIPKTIAGITSVTNETPAVGGYDVESDDSLRSRYFAQLQTPATSGNTYHYQQWALEVPGVGGAKVFPLWLGDNTVQVVVIDEDKKSPSPSLVADVQEYIDPNVTGEGRGQAPIGAYCTVTAATEMAVNVTVSLTTTGGSVDIRPAIREYLKEIAFKQDYVSLGRIGTAIMNTPGVVDYDNLRINNSTSNLAIPAKSVAVLGAVNVSG